MMDSWTAEQVTGDFSSSYSSWVPPSQAPYVASNYDFGGWPSAKPWDAEPPTFFLEAKNYPGGGILTAETERALDQLLSLPDNWNGHGGVPPSAAAVDQAKMFYRLLSTDMATPAIEPSGDGEVNFVWRAPGKYLEVGFSGDGLMSYYGKLGGDEILDDIDPMPATLPKELRIALVAITDGRL